MQYDHLISIGLNCETAFAMNMHYGYVESGLLSWAIVHPQRMADALAKPELIFSGDVIHLADINMFHCAVTNITFHGQLLPEELLAADGSLRFDKIVEERANCAARIRHLVEKHVAIASDTSRKLYICGLHPDILPLPVEELAVWINNIRAAMKSYIHNADFMFILDKTKFNKMLVSQNNDSGTFIKSIEKFAPIKMATAAEYVDCDGYHRIFADFTSTAEHKTKIYKFERKNIATPFSNA